MSQASKQIIQNTGTCSPAFGNEVLFKVSTILGNPVIENKLFRRCGVHPVETLDLIGLFTRVSKWNMKIRKLCNNKKKTREGMKRIPAGEKRD